jgi:small subunit ribosomal protein S6
MTGRRGSDLADLFNIFAFLRRRIGGLRNTARIERREPDGRSHALREHASEPREYEMMVVVAPTVAEEGLQGVVERVSGYVAGQGGTVTSTVNENPWGRRRLAYPINDHRDAFYVLYRFTARGEAINEIEREMKLDESVIRHLVVRYDEMTEHEERAPRQQPDGPGGPPFRRSRPESQTAPASAAPAAEAEEKADEPQASAPEAELEESASEPPAATDEPERPSGEPETDEDEG